MLRFLNNPTRFLFSNLLLRLLEPSAEQKGERGEQKINAGIDRLLDPEVYRLIENVTLPIGRGTTQIDHLVISPYGVFVIETKNMTGWIFGNPNRDEWTQVFYEQKYRFRNPIRHNYTHVKVVQKLFGLEPHQIHNVVVFVGGCTIKTAMPAEVVCEAHELAEFIRSKRMPVIAADGVPRLTERILNKRLEQGRSTHLAHVRNVRRQTANRTLAPAPVPVAASPWLYEQTAVPESASGVVADTRNARARASCLDIYTTIGSEHQEGPA